MGNGRITQSRKSTLHETDNSFSVKREKRQLLLNLKGVIVNTSLSTNRDIFIFLPV